MTSQLVAQAAPNGAIRLRRSFGEYIGAVYRIIFGRPGDHDVFGDALVRWTDFIMPGLVIIFLHLGYTISSTPALRVVMNMRLQPSMLAVGVLSFGVLLRLAVTLVVTWGSQR
jgi:hypothetical protein